MTQRGANYKKQDGDTYMTPQWAVLALLDHVLLFGCVWEPACGHGTILHTIGNVCPYAECIGTDIDEKFTFFPKAFDFLLTPVSEVFETEEAHAVADHPRVPLTIVTNPPYGVGGKLALAFVEKALIDTLPSRGKVIMLLPADWDCAKGRQHLFQRFAGHVTKITLTQRIRWTNIPQAKAGPSSNHAWFIWDHSRQGRDMLWA